MAKGENIGLYQLRCTLYGHTMDVRDIAVTSNSEIITVSRDRTARLWAESNDNKNIYLPKRIYSGHEGYVASVCNIENDDNSSDGLFATGSKDSTILVYSRDSSEPLHKLVGHSDSVSCLTWKSGYLISGSWDHSIKVWKDWICIETLNSHSGPIWAVAIMNIEKSGPVIISASADKTLKLWKNGSVLVSFAGHTDCVRGIAQLNPEQFLSCSNDASIKLWNISGECLQTFYGHSNYIYSLCSSPDQKFASGSEDRSLKVWDSHGTNEQTVYLPSQSVWSVAFLPNSDIVTGTSDGHCRVFTRNAERYANEEELKTFEETLSKFKVVVEGSNDIKKSNLPDKSVLNAPGKQDGQKVMVKDGEKVLCYNWSQTKIEWEAVGEVVGSSSGSSGKVLYEGREYDFVFDVDVDSETVIKLPYNRGEDPWAVSQAFVQRHQLPQDYLDTVANFIMKNAGVSASSNVAGNGDDYCDPFTGGNRYVPQASGGASISGGVSNGRVSSIISSDYFPQKRALMFDSANKEGILSKLRECNVSVSDPFTPDQIEAVVECAVSGNSDLSSLTPLNNALQWHPKNVWPVLDVLRLALRFENVHEQWIKAKNRGGVLVSLLVKLLDPKSSPVNTQLMSLRCLSNMACHSPGRECLVVSRESVFSSALSLSPFTNKNLEIAAATLMVNYSFIYHSERNVEDQCQILSGAATIALSASDQEALFRSAVALGTLISLGGDLIPLANSLDLKPVVENLNSANNSQKLRDCAGDILKLL